MSSLISSQPLPRVSIGSDNSSLTARPIMSKNAVSFCGKGDVVEIEKTGGMSKKTSVIAATVLLIGGALLGYGHRNQISKGLDSMKGSIDKFFSKGKPAEWLDAGKGLLSKAKDMIFAKG